MPGYSLDGWICRRHADGQWVTMRKATDADKKIIHGITQMTGSAITITLSDPRPSRSTIPSMN